MGQTVGTQSSESIIEKTFETFRYEFTKHAQTLKEVGSLTYEEFKNCVTFLNDLSRACLDSKGETTIFAIQKDSDETLLWKATVRIACVKCNPHTNLILHYKMINLQEFLRVFNNLQMHVTAMTSCEEQFDRARLQSLFNNVTDFSPTNESADTCECCICLDRKANLILPCDHLFCSTCIEKWNRLNNKCPICQSSLDSVNDSWVLPDLPQATEVTESIISELNALSKDETNESHH